MRIFDLANLTTTEGFRIDGALASDGSGSSVSKAGDVNGDGVADVIIGASNTSPSNRAAAGSSYIIYGKSGGYNGPIDLAALNITMGISIEGPQSNAQTGWSVSNAGDVNGDGLADVIIGASSAGALSTGTSWVIYGKNGSYTGSIDLSVFNGTSLGFLINGAWSGMASGSRVSTAGDVNSDGIADLIIGLVYSDPDGRQYAGSSYIVYGKREGYTTPVSLQTLSADEGFRVDGAQSNDYSGHSVSTAGDINDDGITDVIIGAYHAYPYGKSYVVYGKSGGYPEPINLATLDPTVGFRLDGDQNGGYSGWSVNTAGDVNGDGLADVIIYNGEPGTLAGSSSYVIYGKKGGYVNPIDLSVLTTNSSLGFRIDGAPVSQNTGYSVSTAGDTNGDGIADVIIGAFKASPNSRSYAGSSYVVYGQKDGYAGPINLASFNVTIGFRIDGAQSNDRSGYYVSGAGDVNADGLADVIIGAPNASPYGRDSAGSSYVVYGSFTPCAIINNTLILPYQNSSVLPTTLITPANLYAIDAFYNSTDNQILFNINNLKAGNFEFISTSQLTTSFTQQQINDGDIRFVQDGSLNIPAYTVSVVNVKEAITSAQPATVSFLVPPLVIGTISDVSAIVGDTSHSFINATEIFKDISYPNQLQFSAILANGRELPSWIQFNSHSNPLDFQFTPPFSMQNENTTLNLIAANPYNLTAYTSFNVFVPNVKEPLVIGNISNVSVQMSNTIPLSINPSKIFQDPQNYPLQYSAMTANGSALPDWVQFREINSDLYSFDINATAPSLQNSMTTLSLIASDPYNLSAHTDFSIQVLKVSNSTSPLTPSTVAGVVAGGVVGLAALAGSAFGFWRYHKGKQFAEERKNYPFADLLREKSQLSGIDDFQSNAGLAFVNAIDVLTNELQLQDIDIRNMYPNELEILSVYVANAIKTTVKISATYFGMYKSINPEDIQNNAGTIARVTKTLCQTPVNEANYGTFINS